MTSTTDALTASDNTDPSEGTEPADGTHTDTVAAAGARPRTRPRTPRATSNGDTPVRQRTPRAAARIKARRKRKPGRK